MSNESKCPYSKGSVDREQLMDVVKEFCTSREFETEFEMFAKEHVEIFRDSANYPIHSKEHPMEYFNIYKKYLAKFEAMIEDFIVKVCC